MAIDELKLEEMIKEEKLRSRTDKTFYKTKTLKNEFAMEQLNLTVNDSKQIIENINL